MSTPASLSTVYPVTSTFRQQTANYVDISQATARQDLMNAQLSTNEPQPPSGVFSIVSDALLPDRTVIDRLGNMDPEIYDLRDTSNIMKIMTALLGGAGAGGLRKQTAVARLENSFATTHFLDLDRFYGALFGIVRTNAELMPDFGALTDDSGTLAQAQPAGATYTLHRDADFAAATAVTNAAGNAYTLGEQFEVTSPILVSALRYWRASTGVLASSMLIYDLNAGQPVVGSQITPINPPATTGWHTTALGTPVVLGPGRYIVAAQVGNVITAIDHFFDTGLLATTAVVGPVRFLSQAEATNGIQGLYTFTTTPAMPATQASNARSYGLDLIFTDATVTSTSGGVQFDPYTDAAGSDVWDDVHSRDASYRARLIKFARAIPQGGTYAGLLAAAEAILAVECELYESWTWCDDLADHGGVAVSLGYTWGQMEKAFSTWGAVERQHTWSTFAGRVLMMGRTGTSNRSEIQLVPKRALRLDEQYQLVRVLNALKPAGVSITVDSHGLAVHEQTAIRAVAADSEYWEVTSRVVPAAGAVTSTGTSLYETVVPGQPQPRPAFSQYTGEAWSCNNDITRVTSYEMQGDRALTSTDYETVVYGDGTSHAYVPSEALIPGAHAAAARAACDGVLTSHPYCAPRARAGRPVYRR